MHRGGRNSLSFTITGGRAGARPAQALAAMCRTWCQRVGEAIDGLDLADVERTAARAESWRSGWFRRGYVQVARPLPPK